MSGYIVNCGLADADPLEQASPVLHLGVGLQETRAKLTNFLSLRGHSIPHPAHTVFLLPTYTLSVGPRAYN